MGAVLRDELRQRVAEKIEEFGRALDAAKEETPENFEELEAAADEAMRAIGRVLIEVQRRPSVRT